MTFSFAMRNVHRLVARRFFVAGSDRIRAGKPIPCPLASGRTVVAVGQYGFRHDWLLRRACSSTTNNEVSHADVVEPETMRERPISSSGHILRQNDDELDELERALKSALELYQSLSPNDPRARPALEAVRDCYENMLYWDDALAAEQALEELLLVEEDDEEQQAARAYRRGKLYMRLQNLVEASRYYKEALNIYERIYPESYRAEKGNVLISIAGIRFHREQLQASLQLLMEAEPHFRKHGLLQTSEAAANDLETPNLGKPHVDLVKCLQHQGLLHRTTEDFAAALNAYQEALHILETFYCSDTENVVQERRQGLQMDVADMRSALDEFDSALAMYETILSEDKERRQRNGDKESTALDGVMLHSMGKINAQLGNVDLAIVQLTQALDLKRQFVGEFHPEVAKTLSALGAVQALRSKQSDPDTGYDEARRAALECFQQALLISRMHAKERERDPLVMLAMRNIALLKGDSVPKWNSVEENDKQK
jgi:tetratricopeptide (TPR) repeat protein